MSSFYKKHLTYFMLWYCVIWFFDAFNKYYPQEHLEKYLCKLKSYFLHVRIMDNTTTNKSNKKEHCQRNKEKRKWYWE